MLDKYKRNQFLELAKKKGSVTWREIQDYFGENIVESKDFDALLFKLDEEHVKVVNEEFKSNGFYKSNSQREKEKVEDERKKLEEKKIFEKVRKYKEFQFKIKSLVNLANENNNILSYASFKTVLTFDEIFIKKNQFSKIIGEIKKRNILIENIGFDTAGRYVFINFYEESLFQNFNNFNNPEYVKIILDMEFSAIDKNLYQRQLWNYLIKGIVNTDSSLANVWFIATMYKVDEKQLYDDVFAHENNYKIIDMTNRSKIFVDSFYKEINDKIKNFIKNNSNNVDDIIRKIAIEFKISYSQAEILVIKYQILINREVKKFLKEIFSSYTGIKSVQTELTDNFIYIPNSNSFSSELVIKELEPELSDSLYEELYYRQKLKLTDYYYSVNLDDCSSSILKKSIIKCYCKTELDNLCKIILHIKRFNSKLANLVINKIHEEPEILDIFREYLKREEEYKEQEKKIKEKSKEKYYKKAIGKIPLWAYRYRQNNHKIIRAYFKAFHRFDEPPTKDMIKEICSNIKDTSCYISNFQATYASMKSDTEHSNGKVFIDDGTYVQIWDEVEDVLLRYEKCFYNNDKNRKNGD